MEFGYMDGGK